MEPKLVIRVEFADWTADNLLRQAAFKGLEIGKAPTAVRREREVDTATATAAAEREVQTEPMQTTDDEAALDGDRARGRVARGRSRGARHEPGEGPLSRPRWGSAGHEARPVQVPPRHRADAGAVPARPRIDRAALPERRRGEGLLAEGPAEARARLGQSMDVPPSRGGTEGLPGRRRARHAPVAGAGGGDRAPSVDVAARDAGPALVRAHRHRPRPGHHLGRGRHAGSAVSDRPGAPRRSRPSQGHRQAWHPGLDRHPPRSLLRRDERLGRRALARRRLDRSGSRQLGVGEARAEGQGAARLHAERDQQDARRALQPAAGPRCAGQHADRLGRAGRRLAAPGQVDDSRRPGTPGGARRPLRIGPDRSPGAARRSAEAAMAGRPTAGRHQAYHGP